VATLWLKARRTSRTPSTQVVSVVISFIKTFDTYTPHNCIPILTYKRLKAYTFASSLGALLNQVLAASRASMKKTVRKEPQLKRLGCPHWIGIDGRERLSAEVS
jgi:hypothetical protein